MNLFNINKINNINFNDLVNDEMDKILNENSTNGLQNKVIYNLIKRLYLLLKINGYNDEYFDDLVINNHIYRINYLANNKVIVNNIEIAAANEKNLANNIIDAEKLIINNERIENVNISYITKLTNLNYCECISNNLILSDNITILSNLKTLIIPKPIETISINCDSNLKFCSFVNNKEDLETAFDSLNFTNEPIKYYGISNNIEDMIELNDLSYENMYVDLKNFTFYKSRSNNLNIKNIILSNSNKINNLGERCFQNCQNLTSINIPISVSSFENYCFNNCSNLSSINPISVNNLGNSCFNNCSNLTFINIPISVSSIGNYCFQNCQNLTSINIPISVSSLGTYCFKSCTNLKSIIIPTSINNLGERCFQICKSLESITMPTSINSLGDYCFSACVNLLTIDIPTSVTSLGKFCFSSCEKLESIDIPTSVTSLGNGCFSYCFALESIDIPTSVVNSINACFYSCTNLKSINIPTSINSLGANCFENCQKLSFIMIPTSVTSLGDSCFDTCYGLSSIIIPTSVNSLGDGCFQSTKSNIQFKISTTVIDDANSLAWKIKNTSGTSTSATYYYYNETDDDWILFTPMEPQ